MAKNGTNDKIDNAIANSRKKVMEVFPALEEQLKSDFFLGEEMTIVDIMFYIEINTCMQLL